MEDEGDGDYNLLVDFILLKVICVDNNFNTNSVIMDDQETKYESIVAETGLLVNEFSELERSLWVGLFGEN